MKLWKVIGLGLVIVASCVGVQLRRAKAKAVPVIVNLGSASRQNSFPKGQCTWYAFERALDSGSKLRFSQSYGRDAKAWPRLVLNRHISRTPTRGSVMVLDGWRGNPFGHVAFVESVQGKSTWTVSHANMGAGEAFGLMDGVSVRRVTCHRMADGSIEFPGYRNHFRLIGFLITT